MKHIDISVVGKVQGVFFRSSAEKKAKELGITGYAKNMEDGTVYIEAEGEEDKLKIFLEWCKSGPEHAKVEDVTAQDSHSIKGFKEFNIF